MEPNLSANTQWDGLPMPRRIWAIVAVAFGVSVSVLDGSIANVALPTIASQLGVSAADSIWVVNGYQLAIMVTLLSFSALGDIIGYRNIYIGGLTLFTVSSVACALSGSLTTLVISRAAQGIGAAAITSVNTTLIRVIYPRNRLGRGMGINATVVAISAVAGPSLASAVLSVGEWPWLFIINIPVGLIAIAFSSIYLPKNPPTTVIRKFDWRDGIFNALIFGLLIFTIEGASHGLSAVTIITLAAMTIIAGSLFVRNQLHKQYPVLPFDLLRIPIFSLSICTSICSFTAQMLALVSLPFMLQHQLGYTEVETGLLLTAWPAVIIVVAPLAGILIERIHAGILGGVGLTVMTAGLVALLLLPDNPSHFDIVWRLALCGGGFGLFQSPNNSVMIASAPQSRSGSASGMLATARLIGQTAGAAMVALFLHMFPANSNHIALATAAAFALTGSILSFSRRKRPLPEGLRHTHQYH